MNSVLFSTYSEQCCHSTKTTARVATLGARCKPKPKGQPNYIRVDTVHRGNIFQQKGSYHINATDEATQFEVILSNEMQAAQRLQHAKSALFKQIYGKGTPDNTNAFQTHFRIEKYFITHKLTQILVLWVCNLNRELTLFNNQSIKIQPCN